MTETREQLKEREKSWECPRSCWSMGICPERCPNRQLAVLEFADQARREKEGGNHG